MNMIIIKNPEDLAERLLPLYREGLSLDFDEVRLNWLYGQYFTNRHIVLAYEDNGKIVAVISGLFRPLWFSNTQILGMRILDPVVDKRYRGQGLAKRLLSDLLTYSGSADVAYSFPNRLAHGSFLDNLFETIPNYLCGICVLNFWSVSFRDKIKYFFSGAKTLLRQTSNQTVRCVEISEVESLSVQYDNNIVVPDREIDYIRWRYCSSPMSEYTFVLIEGMHGVIALLVLSIHLDKADLVDVLMYNHEKLDVPFVLCWLSKKLHISRLYSWSYPGFVFEPFFWLKQKTTIVVKWLRDDASGVVNRDDINDIKWGVLPGDLEAN